LQDGISGFLVKAGDSLGMARSIEQLAFSSVLRAKFGEQARIAADTRFSLRSMVERYSRMYAGTRREENSPHVVLDGVKG
jgi:glycosyltransferase involved in cell wall biosynthesis